MLEALNNVGHTVQPFGLSRNNKNIPLEVASMSMKLCGHGLISWIFACVWRGHFFVNFVKSFKSGRLEGTKQEIS